MNKYPEGLINWLACGERGLSSNTIVEVLTGVPAALRSGRSHPLDPSDFNRCVKLLNEVPSLRNDLSKMKEVSAQWKNLIDNWELLEETLKFELTRSDGKAPKLYSLMKELEL